MCWRAEVASTEAVFDSAKPAAVRHTHVAFNLIRAVRKFSPDSVVEMTTDAISLRASVIATDASFAVCYLQSVASTAASLAGR